MSIIKDDQKVTLTYDGVEIGVVDKNTIPEELNDLLKGDEKFQTVEEDIKVVEGVISADIPIRIEFDGDTSDETINSILGKDLEGTEAAEALSKASEISSDITIDGEFSNVRGWVPNNEEIITEEIINEEVKVEFNPADPTRISEI